MSKSAIEDLLTTIHTLRSPGGCPWDRKQTLPDASRYLLDEAGELLDAAVSGDREHSAEELGDLLFMVCFCCEILSEEAPFNFEAIARLGNDKLIRRHPHVFGEEKADTQTESQEHWNAIKAREREDRGLPSRPDSQLKDLPASSSPLRQAHEYQKDAARSGFDWPHIDGIWDKLREEIGELEAAAKSGDAAAIQHEVGDLLLVVSNLSRRLGVQSDDALRQANQRFKGRFRHIEKQYDEPDVQMKKASLEELEEHWQDAKRLESME
jgi:nucleoside triphosphate diphosphatase